jgi:hypothetical protein
VAPRGPGLHALSRAIGGLEAEIKALTKIVDEERHQASLHRQSLREVIGSLSEAMRVQAERTATQTEKIAELKTTQTEKIADRINAALELDQRVDALEAKRDQAAGAIWAFRAVWVGAGGGILAGLAWLGRKLGVI